MNLFCYMLYGLGLILACYPWIRGIFRKLFRGRPAGKLARRAFSRADERGKLTGHIARLMAASGGGFPVRDPAGFFVLSAGIGGAAFLALLFTQGWMFSLFAAAAAAAVPYVYLRTRFALKRSDGSREGDILLRELLTNYKLSGNNMREGIERTAGGLREAPVCRSIMLDLSRGLAGAYTAGETARVLEDLRYALGTSWGDALARLIFFSHVRGIDVREALEDLLDSLVRSQQVEEHAKRENSESLLMLRYLAPCCYLLSFLSAVLLFDFTPAGFLRSQFFTPQGVRWFLIAGAFYGAGILMNTLFTKEKLDV